MQGPMTLYNNSQFLICRANEGITHLHTCALKNSFPMHSHWARVKKQKDKNKKKNKKTKKTGKNPKPIFQLGNLGHIPQGENHNSPLV